MDQEAKIAIVALVALVVVSSSAKPRGPTGPKPGPGHPGSPTGPTGPSGCHSEWSKLPRWTKPQLMALAAKHGFPDPNIIAAIALAESSGDPQAVNNCPPREYSVGLWQINILGSKTLTREQMFDPDENCKEAFRRFKERGYLPWGAYTHPKGNPAYRKFL